jgi:hypothetical protein
MASCEASPGDFDPGLLGVYPQNTEGDRADDERNGD